MTTEAKKEAFIIRDFKDATNEQRFTGNTIEKIEEGRFINFEAAGLVRKPTAEDRAAVHPAAPDTATDETAADQAATTKGAKATKAA